MGILNKIGIDFKDEKLDVETVTIFSSLVFFLIVLSLIFFSCDVFLKREIPIKCLEMFSVMLLISIAFILVGMFMGFIFGIPRTHQESSINTSNSTDEHENRYLSANTNLEQISDWLTKIIVGVGLVEIAKISEEFNKLVAFLSNGIGLQNKESIIFSLIIASLILGFLFGYLITRIYLTRAFYRAVK